ncbi:hypothetical protein STRIP9103_07018, partial [Streptomyces ipomoeae 91-03]
GADTGGDRHGGGQLRVRGARVAVQQPDVAEDDTPMPYRETDTAPQDPRLRGRRDTDRGGRPGDAEALEPLPHRRGGAPGEDRAGAHRVQGRWIEVALTVVRAEGDQLEVTVLQRRRGTEQPRDLVDELLVLPAPAATVTARAGHRHHRYRLCPPPSSPPPPPPPPPSPSPPAPAVAATATAVAMARARLENHRHAGILPQFRMRFIQMSEIQGTDA